MTAHVPHLVTEHPCQLVIVAGTGQKPREHEHVAARDGEGVQLRTLHHVEVVLELLGTEHPDQPPPHALDVLRHRRVIDQGKLRAHLEHEAPAELRLAAVGPERPAPPDRRSLGRAH